MTDQAVERVNDSYKVLNIIVLFFFVRILVFSDIVVVCELIVKNVLILNFC